MEGRIVGVPVDQASIRRGNGSLGRVVRARRARHMGGEGRDGAFGWEDCLFLRSAPTSDVVLYTL